MVPIPPNTVPTVAFHVEGGGTATSCSVDGVTLSDMTLTINTLGGSLGAPTLTPKTIAGESGFQLNYSATGPVDFTWTFTVAGDVIGDAFASLTAAEQRQPDATFDHCVDIPERHRLKNKYSSRRKRSWWQ
jgi:hypothetical protein